MSTSAAKESLDKNIEVGEESEGFVEMEEVAVATAFLIAEIEAEQAEHGVDSGDPARRDSLCSNQATKAELGEQRQQQEGLGNACADGTKSFQRYHAEVGARGRMGRGCDGLSAGRPRGTEAKKGTTVPGGCRRGTERRDCAACCKRSRSVWQPLQKSPLDDHGADRFVAALSRQGVWESAKNHASPMTGPSPKSLHGWQECPKKDTRNSP